MLPQSPALLGGLSPSPSMPSKTFPSKSAGPHFPVSPLTSPLLRLVPGHPSHALSPLHWLTPPSDTPLTLHATLGTTTASTPLSSTYPTPACWFDFEFADLLREAYIIFSLIPTHPTPSDPPFFARTHLLHDDFSARHGVLQRTMLDPAGVPLARLVLDFLIVTPSPHAPFQLRRRPDVPRFTGHRGMGSSGPLHPRRPPENTVESFLAATRAALPPHAIEMDVQLTRDGRVVVFHDWFFRPGGERDKDRNADAALRVPIYALTLEQLDKLYRDRGGRMAAAGEAKELADVREERGVREEDDRIWTLAEVGERLPEEVGMLVEVKYPAKNVSEEAGGILYPERNQYIDAVLEELFAVARNRGRAISFLSFDADVCVLLALKQNLFPVYLSHCEVLDKPCEEFDPRCIDLNEGLKFALSQRLDGMMLFNELVQIKPEVVRRILENDLRVITYGSSNSNPNFVQQQFEMGVGGVIADDVDLLLEQLGEQA